MFVLCANFPATSEIPIPGAGLALATCIDVNAHGPRGPLEAWEVGGKQTALAVMQA